MRKISISIETAEEASSPLFFGVLTSLQAPYLVRYAILSRLCRLSSEQLVSVGTGGDEGGSLRVARWRSGWRIGRGELEQCSLHSQPSSQELRYQRIASAEHVKQKRPQPRSRAGCPPTFFPSTSDADDQ